MSAPPPALGPGGFAGIDLTASERRASGLALLSPQGAVLHLGSLRTDGEVLAFAAALQPASIAIDAPLGLPEGWECLDQPCSCGACAGPGEDRRRRCERELAARGIPCYWTTRRSIIREMVYRGMELRYALEKRGHRVVEVYPFGTKLRLWGRPILSKQRPEGLAWLRQRLAGLFPDLGARAATLSHDAADALLAAHTARLHALGGAEVLGDAGEGQILLPLS